MVVVGISKVKKLQEVTDLAQPLLFEPRIILQASTCRWDNQSEVTACALAVGSVCTAVPTERVDCSQWPL